MAESEDQSATQEYREPLQAAYSFVEGQKVAQAFAARTPEDCYDDFIERVAGPGRGARLNVLEKIARIKADVLAAVERVKALPPEAFRDPKPDEDANTPA